MGVRLSHDTIPTTEPLKLLAGDSWQWDRSVLDHAPSDGWELTYYLRRQGATLDSAINISTTDVSDVYQVRVAGSVTKDYLPGLYRLIGRVTKDTDVFTVHQSVITVMPDPVEQLASFAETMVSQIEAELLARTDPDREGVGVERWRQGDREEQAGQQEIATLQKQLGYWRDQVRIERTGNPFIPVRAEFTRV